LDGISSNSWRRNNGSYDAMKDEIKRKLKTVRGRITRINRLKQAQERLPFKNFLTRRSCFPNDSSFSRNYGTILVSRIKDPVFTLTD
jgi:hypothetical protein